MDALLNDLVVSFGGASWILDGPRPAPTATGDHDPDRELIPALAELRFEGADPDADMEQMDAFLEARNAPGAVRVVAAVASAEVVILGALLPADPSTGVAVTATAERALKEYDYSTRRWVVLTQDQVSDRLGALPAPIPRAHQVAALVYELLGMPLTRLRTHKLDQCPIPELRHACGREYFWCAHEAAFAGSLIQLKVDEE